MKRGQKIDRWRDKYLLKSQKLFSQTHAIFNCYFDKISVFA